MPITHIHTYLVHPAKGVFSPKPIGGSEVALAGKMFDLLKGVYDRSDAECDVAISFNHNGSGAQQNDCRDLIIQHVLTPSLATGRQIAERLAAHTDNRPRQGLLFVLVGKEGRDHKVIVSRFPADSAISAEQSGTSLNVEFLEKVFMKSARAYKAVLYRDSSPRNGMWSGKVIDRQMNDIDGGVSGYWINDFLASDFLTTAASGTRRLAIACRHAARTVEDPAIKSEIAAAVTLAPGQTGKTLSAQGFVDRLCLSDKAKTAILDTIKPDLRNDVFQFNAEEFTKQVAFKSVELDNGGVMMAETSKFDDIFRPKIISKTAEKYRFSTEGVVVGSKLTKSMR